MIVRELLTRLGFDVDTSGGVQFDRVLRGVALGATAAVTAVNSATGAIMAFANAQAEQITTIGRQAQLAGESFEKFQTSVAAGAAVGFDSDRMADTLKDVNDKIGDFLSTGGGELADYFEQIAPRIGQTAEQFRGLSGSDALQLYFNGLERANLSQAEMTFYLEAIANDATGLIPILRNGGAEWQRLAAEAEEYGVLTEEQLATSVEFSSAMGRLANIFRVMRQRIAVELMPTLRLYIEQLLSWYRLNRELIEQRVVDTLKAVLYAFQLLLGVIRTAVEWFAKLVDWVGGGERAIRLLTVAFGLLIAARVIRGIMALRTAILAMNVAAWANPFGVMVLAIIAVIALVAALVLVGEDFIVWLQGGQSQFGEWYQYIADKLRELGAWFATTFEEIFGGWDGLMQRLRDGWAEGIQTMKDLWSGMVEFFTSILEGDILGALDVVVAGFRRIIDIIWGLWSDMAAGVAALVTSMIPSMPSMPEWLRDLNPFGPGEPVDPTRLTDLTNIPSTPVGPRIPPAAPAGPRTTTVTVAPEININPTGPMTPAESERLARELAERMRREMEDSFATTLPNFPDPEAF